MCAAIDIISVGPFSESFAWCQVANVMQRQLCVAIDLGRIVSFNHLELHIKKKEENHLGYSGCWMQMSAVEKAIKFVLECICP